MSLSNCDFLWKVSCVNNWSIALDSEISSYKYFWCFISYISFLCYTIRGCRYPFSYISKILFLLTNIWSCIVTNGKSPNNLSFNHGLFSNSDFRFYWFGVTLVCYRLLVLSWYTDSIGVHNRCYNGLRTVLKLMEVALKGIQFDYLSSVIEIMKARKIIRLDLVKRINYDIVTKKSNIS